MIDNLLFHCYPLLLSPAGSAFPQPCVPANALAKGIPCSMLGTRLPDGPSGTLIPQQLAVAPRIGQHLVDSQAQSSGTVFHYGCEDWNIYVERPPIYR